MLKQTEQKNKLKKKRKKKKGKNKESCIKEEFKKRRRRCSYKKTKFESWGIHDKCYLFISVYL